MVTQPDLTPPIRGMIERRMDPNVIDLCQYPVKGMNGTRVATATLEPGRGMPGDRRFAIARGGGAEVSFLGLTRHARLATLTAEFDASASVLTIARQGRSVARGDVGTPAGRATIEQFFSAYMAKELNGPARLMDAADNVEDVRATGTAGSAGTTVAGHVFVDPSHEHVHIINLASVRDLERVVGEPVDLRRFRANVIVDGIPAWSEFDWLDGDVSIGGVTFHVQERTERCAATNVNPVTAARDLNLPLTLRRGFGHLDFGVYARVVEGGCLETPSG